MSDHGGRQTPNDIDPQRIDRAIEQMPVDERHAAREAFRDLKTRADKLEELQQRKQRLEEERQAIVASIDRHLDLEDRKLPAQIEDALQSYAKQKITLAQQNKMLGQLRDTLDNFVEVLQAAQGVLELADELAEAINSSESVDLVRRYWTARDRLDGLLETLADDQPDDDPDQDS